MPEQQLNLLVLFGYELDNQLYAHTSPIDVELGGKRIFRRKVAEALMREMGKDLQSVQKQGTFADDPERQAVSRVYEAGLKELQRQLDAARVGRQQ